MDCRREEVRRVLGGRLFWILFAGALVVNFWFIINYEGNVPMVAAAVVLEENGVHHVTEENKEEIIAAFAGREPGNAQISVCSAVEAVPRMAEHLEAADFAEIFIEDLRLAGKAADMVRNACAPLEELLLRDRKNNTAVSLFVPCTAGFFDLFAYFLPIACTVEASLAAVLLMLRCVNAPYDNRSKELVYTTKTGRRLNRLQTESALFTILLFAVALWGSTILLAEGVFRMGELWQVKVGSMMMLHFFYPILCRFSISLSTYMLLQAALSVCMALLFGIAAAFFVTRTHRTVTAFFKISFCCALAAAAAEIAPRDSLLFFILRFQPVEFVKKAGRWFASGAGFLSVRYYEAAFVLFWGALLLLLLIRQYKKFRLEDI